MGMFIRLVLIFPILIYIGRWIHKQNKIIRIGTFFVILKGFMYITVHQSAIKSGMAKLIFGQPTDLQMRFVNISILFWSIYVIFGMYAAFNYEIFNKVVNKFRYVIYGVFVVAFYYKFSRQFELVDYSLIFDILYRTSNILMFYIIGEYVLSKKVASSVIAFISKYSYAGYMIHIYALYKIIFALRGVGINNPVGNAILSAIGATFLATFIVYAITLIPKSKFITGVNDNFSHLKNIANKFLLSRYLSKVGE